VTGRVKVGDVEDAGGAIGTPYALHKVQGGGDGEFASAGDQVDVVLAANLVDVVPGEVRAPRGHFLFHPPSPDRAAGPFPPVEWLRGAWTANIVVIACFPCAFVANQVQYGQ
jgi:hypothetical protein